MACQGEHVAILETRPDFHRLAEQCACADRVVARTLRNASAHSRKPRSAQSTVLSSNNRRPRATQPVACACSAGRSNIANGDPHRASRRAMRLTLFEKPLVRSCEASTQSMSSPTRNAAAASASRSSGPSGVSLSAAISCWQASAHASRTNASRPRASVPDPSCLYHRALARRGE
jgi:hypothetical protein